MKRLLMKLWFMRWYELKCGDCKQSFIYLKKCEYCTKTYKTFWQIFLYPLTDTRTFRYIRSLFIATNYMSYAKANSVIKNENRMLKDALKIYADHKSWEDADGQRGIKWARKGEIYSLFPTRRTGEGGSGIAYWTLQAINNDDQRQLCQECRRIKEWQPHGIQVDITDRLKYEQFIKHQPVKFSDTDKMAFDTIQPTQMEFTILNNWVKGLRKGYSLHFGRNIYEAIYMQGYAMGKGAIIKAIEKGIQSSSEESLSQTHILVNIEYDPEKSFKCLEDEA